MINVDFADVKTIMSSMGRALMGTGYGKGDRRAIDAATMAINSPLLDDVSVEGASGVLLNFTAGPDVKLREINEAASLVQQEAHEDANIIFGLVTDMDMGDVVKVTVIATGFDVQPEELEQVQPAVARQSRPTLPISVPAQRRAPAARSSRPARRASHAPEQVSLAESRGGRAFGASALHDEAVLDIPAYLRRGAAHD